VANIAASLLLTQSMALQRLGDEMDFLEWCSGCYPLEIQHGYGQLMNIA
jgi:hypothetical protein